MSLLGRCCRKRLRFDRRAARCVLCWIGLTFDSCLGVDADASKDAYAAAVANARVRFGGGPSVRSARVFRFCTMAARWNSSRAPERPRSRIRSKPWWVFRCANLISTRFLSSRDLANPFVFIFRRATSRASSWRSRGILRASALVQHLVLSGHISQSRFEAR